MHEEGQRPTEKPIDEMSNHKLGVYALFLIIFWASVVVYTVHPALPANPIELPFEEQSPMIFLLPQGWAFFTRDPKSLNLSAYLKSPEGTWLHVSRDKGFWPHLFKFSRRWKLPGIEIGLVINEPDDLQWHECLELPTTCLEQTPSSGSVENKLPHPSLCGDVGIVRQTPIPWAWSQAPDETVMPSEVLRLQVSCHE
ncbi:MAG TPA: SdpA family antimicrobial peptide system protein [Pyrinomonadaceae bacterium]|nr:SdpA family antimicrobial peptide system protein [Pyrinomonadaceae bacterium]